MKTIAVMQPYFLPYLGYFQLIKAVDVFVVYDDVNFINKGWMNRNFILGRDQKQLFTLPLNKASQNKLINEIELFDFNQFKNNFKKTLEFTYKRSPYYTSGIGLVDQILEYKGGSLTQLILHSFEILLNYFDIPTRLVTSSSMYENKHLKAQERIIDICEKEKATNYINPIGGLNLYSKEKFEDKGIGLNFIETKELMYSQTGNSFTPYLSVIDVIMFNSQKEIIELLKQYTIIKK